MHHVYVGLYLEVGEVHCLPPQRLPWGSAISSTTAATPCAAFISTMATTHLLHATLPMQCRVLDARVRLCVPALKLAICKVKLCRRLTEIQSASLLHGGDF